MRINTNRDRNHNDTLTDRCGWVFLIIACLAAYYPILFNDFLYHWDDQWMVMNRFTESGISLNNLWSILTQFYHGQYGPVNEYMYVFIYSIFGYNPMAFHAASLILHIGNVCLAYIIIKRIFQLTNRMSFDHAPFVAFITALLFAVHPMNVESVAWVSASKILVYSFFYLLSTYTLIIYLEKKKLVYYILSLLLFAFSFGGKEQAVIFPVWLLMLYWLVGYSFKARKVWIQVAPFFMMALIFGIVSMSAQASGGMGMFANEVTYPLWQRFILGCYSIVEYIVKFTIPFNLLYIYPFPMLIGAPLPNWMLLYPAMILVILMSLWNYLKQIPLSVGLTFFLIHIALVLHIVPLSRFSVIADRYIYLPCIGLAFIIAFYFVRFLAYKKGKYRKIAIGCIVCITICLGIYSNIRCRDWKDTDSIKREFRELLEKRDDYVAPEFEKLLEDEKEDNSGTDVSETDEKLESNDRSKIFQKREDTQCVFYNSINF